MESNTRPRPGARAVAGGRLASAVSAMTGLLGQNGVDGIWGGSSVFPAAKWALITRSYCEIYLGGAVASTARLHAPRQIVHVDAGQRPGKRTLGLGDRRRHHVGNERRRNGAVVVAHGRGGPHDLVDADVDAFARERVAAVRAAHAAQDAVVHEGLEHRFEMTRGQAVAGRKSLGRNRAVAAV